MDLHAQLSAALTDIKAGRFQQALSSLTILQDSRPKTPDVWRLSAMAARKTGAYAQAERWLETALSLEADNPESWNALGLTQDALNRAEAAFASFQTALQKEPQFVPAAINLARLHLRSGAAQQALAVMKPFAHQPQAQLVLAQAYQRSGHPQTALELYAGLVRREPQNVHAHYGLAVCLIELGDPARAMPTLDALSQAGFGPAHYPRFTALARLGRHEEALQAVQAALRDTPTDSSALHGMAQLYWMMGRASDIAPRFEACLTESQEAVAVYAAYLDVLIQMERFEDARALADRAGALHGENTWLNARRLSIEIESGAADAACDLALAVLEEGAPASQLRGNLARALLMGGAFDQSRPLIEEAMAAAPGDRFWVAMQATQARVDGDRSSYEALVNLDDFTMTAPLKTPDGYRDLTHFNADLAKVLRRMHDFTAAPLDQSLRAGSQTPTDLRHSKEPVIQAFFAMVEHAFNTYRDQLSPQAGHPLLGAIPDHFELAGAWSVRLQSDGRHVNHVHPEGWISSVYYVDVPPQVAGSPEHEGWLKFAEPPFDVAGLGPERYVEPRAGELTLFPSYLWHGTVPIQSGERLTIAFDIKPSESLAYDG
jgi:tetratricopeptide (TPR) repeat protein